MAVEASWSCHCADLAVAQVRAATARDIWAELGGRPSGWREAAALYRRLGVRSLAEAVGAVLGEPVDPKRAGRGDIAQAGWALGVVRGDLVEFTNAVLPLSCADRAWKVRGSRGG